MATSGRLAAPARNAEAGRCVWPMVKVSPSGWISSATDAFAACVGMRADELPGTSFLDLLHPEDVPRAAALMQATDDAPVELRFVRPGAPERILLVGPSHTGDDGTVALLCCDLTRERLAEAAARADARRYEEMIRSASDWAWEMDAELRYTYFSPNLETLTSIRPASVIGKRRDEIADRSHDPEKWAEHLATLRAHKPFRDFVYRSKQPDGRMFWIKASGTPVFAEDGRFLGYRGVASDVTAQIAAEQALAKSERRLRALLEVASDWFWETDAEGRFTFLSAAWSKVTGQNPADHLGRKRAEIGDRTHDPEAWRQHLALLEARKPFRNFTYPMRTPHGKPRWVRTSGIPAFDEYGQFTGYLGAAADVTVETEARQGAEAIHRRFAEAIESVPASLMVHDAEDRLVICNSITRQYFANAAHSLMPGSTFEDFIRVQAETIPEAAGRIEAWVAERIRAHHRPENEITQRDSHGRWLHIIERRMSDGGTIGISVDITGLKQAEEQRLALEAQLQHAQKLEALGTLAGGVAHELNNTLVPVLGLAKLTLRRLPEGSREQDNLITILQAGEKARDLVQRIVAFSRKEMPVRLKVDLAALTHGALALLRHSLPSTIRLEERLQAVPAMLGDPAQLPQIVINLVVNAVQATKEQTGTVIVEVATAPGERLPQMPERAPGAALRLSVIDQGCGMDKATVARIFEPFFTTKKVGEGTGLGLSVVHGIVTQHGGHISVDSKPDRGTRVDIYLPAEDATDGPVLENEGSS